MVGYFALYLCYLSLVHLEGEFLHWVFLVAVPIVGLAFLNKDEGLFGAVAGVWGGRRGEPLRGWIPMLAAIALGLGFCGLQFAGSRSGGEAIEFVRSGRALYLAPLSLALMIATAASTEECFFRGVLQTRLADAWGVPAGIFGSIAAFVVFHVPYAYLHPGWASHGDWGAAWSAAASQGLVTGIVLTLLRAWGGRLAPCIVLHALINTVPGMAIVAKMMGEA